MDEKTEPEYRELQKLSAFDRQMHIQKGLDMGLTREQAEKHADEEHARWSPGERERDVAEPSASSGSSD